MTRSTLFSNIVLEDDGVVLPEAEVSAAIDGVLEMDEHLTVPVETPVETAVDLNASIAEAKEVMVAVENLAYVLKAAIESDQVTPALNSMVKMQLHQAARRVGNDGFVLAIESAQGTDMQIAHAALEDIGNFLETTLQAIVAGGQKFSDTMGTWLSNYKDRQGAVLNMLADATKLANSIPSSADSTTVDISDAGFGATLQVGNARASDYLTVFKNESAKNHNVLGTFVTNCEKQLGILTGIIGDVDLGNSEYVAKLAKSLAKLSTVDNLVDGSNVADGAKLFLMPGFYPLKRAPKAKSDDKLGGVTLPTGDLRSNPKYEYRATSVTHDVMYQKPLDAVAIAGVHGVAHGIAEAWRAGRVNIDGKSVKEIAKTCKTIMEYDVTKDIHLEEAFNKYLRSVRGTIMSTLKNPGEHGRMETISLIMSLDSIAHNYAEAGSQAFSVEAMRRESVVRAACRMITVASGKLSKASSN